MEAGKSPSRFAFLVGCDEYLSLPALHCPSRDVSDMAKVLADPAVGGFDKIATFAHDESNGEILAELEDLITNTAAMGDTVVIYFSGHGKLDQLGKLYLAVHKSRDAALDATSIAIDRIIGYADRSACQTILLILDCCYSGAIKGVFRKGGVDGALIGATQGRGLHIMTSSTDIQQSHEKEGETNSVFTKFLLEGLRSGQADVDNNGFISADEAFSYAEKLVKGTGLQNPTKFNVNVSGEIILARNCNYVPVDAPDPNLLSPEDFPKFFAVKNMIDLLKAKPAPKFMVSMPTYYIEGEPYHTAALTVSPYHTLNIRQTQTGFECDTFYKPQQITAKGRAGKELVNGVIKVRLRVDLKDIWFIIGALNEGQGRQIQLYPAPGAG